MNLSCHSLGDKRFSPLFCRLEAFGTIRSIKEHYQLTKRFQGKPAPMSWQEAEDWHKQGIACVGFELPNGLWLPPDTKRMDDLAVQFYIALWLKYLRLHPELIAIASEYDEFEDIFQENFQFSQADIIRQAVRDGLDSFKPMCESFLDRCRHFIARDLLKMERGIIAHQVNLKGKMGAGLALQIRRRYPAVWEQYRRDYQQIQLGQVQLVPVSQSLYVANLAAQTDYGIDRRQTDYDALARCLAELADFSRQLHLTPYLPHGLGCGLAGGDWRIVCGLILRHCPQAVVCRL
jgi:O-acetyl-ADP-ribose deacetylase (regulator of RNase III)